MRAAAQKHLKTGRERRNKAHPEIDFRVRLESSRRASV
jgi:hypothetical protein